MICADTNIFIDFFRGANRKTTDLLQKSLDEKQLLMNPFVLSELLSSPKLPSKTEKYLLTLPRLEVNSGFFERSGYLRRKIYQKGKGISIADIYIAQSCIDSDIPLITVDDDLIMVSRNSELKTVTLS